jgi:hypothetical protein
MLGVTTINKNMPHKECKLSDNEGNHPMPVPVVQFHEKRIAKLRQARKGRNYSDSMDPLSPVPSNGAPSPHTQTAPNMAQSASDSV